MARIIQTQEQTEALKSVKSELKNLKNINDFLELSDICENQSVVFSVNLSGANIKMLLDKKTAVDFILKQRQKIQKDILNSASRFCIMLDDADMKILGERD